MQSRSSARPSGALRTLSKASGSHSSCAFAVMWAESSVLPRLPACLLRLRRVISSSSLRVKACIWKLLAAASVIRARAEAGTAPFPAAPRGCAGAVAGFHTWRPTDSTGDTAAALPCLTLAAGMGGGETLPRGRSTSTEAIKLNQSATR